MPDPLVSVKMITYNHGPYIAQAIDGVLLQRRNFPIELVIGEDCSTDGTREIVFDYRNKYPEIIRVITSEKNVGMRKNGYRTTKACRGKYIAFCEGDDYWVYPYKLEEQISHLEKNPKCGMVLADCDLFYQNSGKYVRKFNWRKGFKTRTNFKIQDIVFGDMVKFTCTVVARRDLYSRVIDGDSYLHQDEIFLMGDMQVWAEISMLSSVDYFPEVVGVYRVLDESATRSKNKAKSLKFLISGSKMKLYLCDKYKLGEKYRSIALSELWGYSLRLAFHERNPELAFEVKKEKRIFTCKEWIRYLGAKYSIIHYGYSAASFCFSLFRKEPKQWP